MPKLSTRAEALPASPIRKLVPLADAAEKRGVGVYYLNIGQPDIPTPPQFFEAVDQSEIAVLAYSHSAGNESLRQHIADYYQRLGQGIQSDQIIVTTGASEALSFVFAAITNPSDEIIVPEPFYANYNSFSLAKDAKVVPVTTHIENDFALPSIDAFREKINERTRAILICNPGNPTGILYTREELEALRDLAKEHDLFLIADEVYREFAYDSSQHLSVLGFDGVDENVVVIDSISKRFSACGARIGCVISRNNELMDVIMKMAQARLSPPTFGQMGAEAAYQLPASYYEEVVDEYRGRRDVLKEALAEIPDVVCPNINGAFYAMVQLPVESAEDFCHWLLDEFEYEGKTVMLAPGAGFYATPGLGADQVRIAYVLKQEDLRSAMACLAAGLKAYRARTESVGTAS